MIKTTLKNGERLQDLALRYPSESKFHMYRNVSYGAAGILLLLIVLLAQISEGAKSLTICLYSSALGLPIWVCQGALYEYYILLGKRSYSHYRSSLGRAILGITFSLAGMSTLVSICSLLYYLDKTSLWIFFASLFTTVIVFYVFHCSLANIIFKK